jgi:transcriptional regulator GlxA family with amidase domain
MENLAPFATRSPPPKRVLIIAPAPAQLLDLAGPAEVFSQAGRLFCQSTTGTISAPICLYDVTVVVVPGLDTTDGRTTSCGLPLSAGPSLEALLADRRPLDTLILGGGEGARRRAEEPELREAVGQLAGRARRVASVCTGAFVLAATGLLDGRRTATHWRWCALLARRYPRLKVEPDPIYTRDGNIWTSAGVTAGMDLALALVEEDFGHVLALSIARELVMFLRRPGGQGQFSATLAAQTASAPDLHDLVGWISDNLHRPLTVEALAARTRYSPRQFARVFVQALGVSPGLMVDRMRIEAARRLLEETPQGLAAIAAACGFGTEEALRRAFLRHLGVPPGAYRDRFRCRPAAWTLSSPHFSNEVFD